MGGGGRRKVKPLFDREKTRRKSFQREGRKGVDFYRAFLEKVFCWPLERKKKAAPGAKRRAPIINARRRATTPRKKKKEKRSRGEGRR